MITEEKLHKVYDKVTEENILKTKELLEMGFTSNDLTKLVKDKVLSRVKRGEYILADIESLFYYGKKAIEAKDYVKANAIFTACYKINPNHEESLFQLFFENIKKENLDESFKFLDLLIKNSTEAYQRDYNVYLYLFNQFYTLPPNYQSYVQSLNEVDLIVLPTDRRFKDKSYENKIRKAIYHKQNASVNNLLFNSPNDLKVINMVIKIMISIAYKKQVELNKILIELIKDKNFEKIVELLSVERNPNSLTPNLYNILIVAQDILEIKRTGIILEASNIETNNYLRAITLHNYALALSLSKKFNASRGRKDEDVALTLILKAIMREIKQIETQNKVPNKSVISEIESNILNRDMPAALENIKTFLASINKSEYEVLIINYIKLNLLRKKKDIYVITNLLNGLIIDEININISQLVNEYKISMKDNYTEKLNILTIIFAELEKLGIEIPKNFSKEKENDSADSIETKTSISNEVTDKILKLIEGSIQRLEIPMLLKYIQNFLKSINKSEYEHLAVLLTKLCLVRKGKNFKLIIDFLLGLRNKEIILNTSDIIKEYELSKKNNNFEKANLLLEIIKELEKLGIITDVVSKLTNESNNKPLPKQPIKESKNEIEPIPSKQEIEVTPILKELTIEEKEFMATIYKRLEEDGLIILDESDSSKINIEIFNKEYNFKAHAFRIDNNCIVVKVTRYVNSNDAREYTRLGDEAFKNGNWEEAIKVYQELLPLRNTFARVYANIGIAYMNLNNISEAIKFLTIATGLSKLNPSLKYDYSKLINELKVRLATNTKNEQKYGIDNTDLNDYYGVSNIKEIVSLINEGKTLDEASQILNISSNERNMIGLLLARDCYARKEYELGDSYINQVEENPYKSKQVVAFLESLKQNKLLYQDKVNESYQALISTAIKEPTLTKTTKVSLKELFRKAQSTEIIESPNTDKKASVKRSESEFKNDLNNNYGVKRLNEVLLLMNFQGMSATEACEVLCLDISESSKIFVILARECYALKEFEVGDRYLSEAEKRLPTPIIKKAISDIRNNKRFYSNRIDENYKPLVRERTLRI